MPKATAGPVPIIARANYVQFAPGQRVRHGRLKSRLLIHTRSGRGQVRVNGEVFEMGPGQLLWMSWACRASYHGDARDPFFLAGVHLVPYARPGCAVVREVSHHPDDPWDHNPDYRDADDLKVPTAWHGLMRTDHALSALMDYTIRRCSGPGVEEPVLRGSAELLWAELARFFSEPEPDTRPLPIPMQRLVQFIDDHLYEPLPLEELAGFAGRSASWVHRGFTRWLGVTPARYVTVRRIDLAKALLAETALPVGEVGRRVGVPDPYYFSKLFKAHAGVSPTRFRAGSALM